MSVKNQVIVITGAGAGLGKSEAVELAKLGAKVVVNDIRNAEKVVEELTAQGYDAVAYSADISTPEGANGLIQTAIDHYGRIDTVVNNAGITNAHVPFEEEPEALYERTMRVNVEGTRLVCKAAYPIMQKQRYGHIINTTSQAGIFGIGGLSAYSISKGAVHGLTKSLAVEAEAYNITVNEIAPCAATEMVRVTNTPEVAEQLEKMLNPAMIAPLIAYLADPECKINGKCFEAGGGRVSEIFLGTCIGYMNPDITLDELSAKWDDVIDRTDFAEIKDGLHSLEVSDLAAKKRLGK